MQRYILFYLFMFVLLFLNCRSGQSNVGGVTGTIQRYHPFTSQYITSRNVDIWLPPSYLSDSTQKYPVLYMHDGQNLFDPSTSFIGVDWGVDEVITRLVKEKQLPEAIVVGIWNTSNRLAEYMPQKALPYSHIPDSLKQFFKGATTLRSDDYLKFMVRELKPFIDSTFRTLPDRKHTWIGGSSMGGLISLYAICEYPEIFGRAACVSTHWPAGNGAMLSYMQTHLPDPSTHFIYFDYGTQTLDSQYEPFQKKADILMKKAGYVLHSNWVTQKFPGHEHSERAWHKRFPVIYKYLTQSR